MTKQDAARLKQRYRLKVAAIRALHAVGGGLIRTFNDAPNKVMLQMNEGLGFQRTASIYRYELRLDGEG